MATLISNSFKSFLNKYQHPSDEICTKHNCHKVIFDLPEPHTVCPKCQQESIDKTSKNVVKSSMNKINKRMSYGILNHDSLIYDDGLANATFDNFEPNNQETKHNLELAKNAAKGYLNASSTANLLFTGLPGRGKSHLALSILKYVNDKSQGKITCMFINTDELFMKIKDSWSNRDNGFTESEVISRLSKVDLLVLDDLGSEATMQRSANEAKDYIQKPLYQTLRKREKKPTIITTNMNSKKLSAIYNGKLVSRFLKGIKSNPNQLIIKFTEETDDKRMVEF